MGRYNHLMTKTKTMIEPIEVVTVVNTSVEDAFQAFVTNINDWWPMDPFSLSKGTLTLEPKLSGKIIETSEEGATFVWGHVTRWDAPHRLDIAWYVGAIEETATQVSVEFATTDDGRTGVTLIQTGWEALGDLANDIRNRNNAGWTTILGTHYANYVTAHCPQIV